MATVTEFRRAILLREDDNVAVATRPIPAGFGSIRGQGSSRSANQSRSGTRSPFR